MTPLTEQVLARLGAPRWLWICLWASVPLLSPLVFGAAVVVSGHQLGSAEFLDLVTTQVVLAYVCVVLLWGTGQLARQATSIREDLAEIVSGEPPAGLFDGIGSVTGPMALAALAVAVVSGGGLVRYGLLPPLAALPLLVVYMIPIVTFIWVYLRILADIDRLGRRPMALDTFPQDRTLGLQKVGFIASTGLGLVLLGAVPVLLAGSDEPVTLGISLAIVAVTVGIFLLSMWRLHRQMSAAKARYTELARDLYARAYEPVRSEPTMTRLLEQASALGAAQSLDERARALPTWPIDEGTLRFIAVVITGVVTSLVVRALFAAVGA